MLRLNPYNFHVTDWTNYNYFLYIICPDDKVAKEVQILKMPSDKYNLLIEKLKKQREKDKLDNVDKRNKHKTKNTNKEEQEKLLKEKALDPRIPKVKLDFLANFLTFNKAKS